MAKMIFAKQKDTGKFVGIDEVERGLACNCVCPHCGATLEARKGEIREHHFKHHDAQETMACYEDAFRVATKKAFSEAGEINLPINRLNEKNEVVNEVFPFKYSSVEILNSVKRSGNGLEILVELKNEKDVPLDVLICTCNKSRKNLENETFRDNISRIRVNLSNVQALTFDEFCRFLSSDIQSKEWIYNRKTKDVKLKQLEGMKKHSCVEKELIVQKNYGENRKSEIENRKINAKEVLNKEQTCYKNFEEVKLNEVDEKKTDVCMTERITYDSKVNVDDGYKNLNINPKEAYNKRMLEIQDEGIINYLPLGKCPYCHEDLVLENEKLMCKGFLCPFTARFDRDKGIISFNKKYGDKMLVEKPVPPKFLGLKENY